jgi:DNA-binding NtrC family response regulator
MKTAEQRRILIIDDQESIRKSLKLALEREGYLVETAENGREAIRKSKGRLYNLALVDLRLPDMDGMELLTAMRESVPKMVKIIITGYPSLENAIEAVNRHADGYIVKPYTMENLLHKIKENLQKQQEAKKYSEKKVREFIEARAEEHESRSPSGRATTKDCGKKVIPRLAHSRFLEHATIEPTRAYETGAWLSPIDRERDEVRS